MPKHVVVLASLLIAVCLSANANEVPDPIGRLDPSAPRLPQNARDIDKLGFAAASLAWARAAHPLRDYKADQTGAVTPEEWQMVEALRALDTVPDSPSDLLAKEQADKRANIVREVIAEGLKKGSLEAAKSALRDAVVQPTVLGDGQGPTRDALRGWLTSTLYGYRTKGLPSEADPMKGLIDEGKKLDDPSRGASLNAKGGGSDDRDIDQVLDTAEKVRRRLDQEGARADAVQAQSVKAHQAAARNAVSPEQLHKIMEHRTNPPSRRPPATVIWDYGGQGGGIGYQMQILDR